MALTSAITYEGVSGGKKVVGGTWTSNTTTGGDITTGLATVEHISICPNKSAVAGNQCVVNETFPLNNVDGKVTIVTDSGVNGTWEAIGT